MVPYKMKFCGQCQESTEHFDDRQYAEDKEQWNCIQCFDRQDSTDALDGAETSMPNKCLLSMFCFPDCRSP